MEGLFTVKFGLDLTIWPGKYRLFDSFIRVASLAGKLGLDSLWLADHLMWAGPNEGSLEVFATLAAVAARTRNITIGSKVMCAAFRHPGVIAQIGATLDIISGGRFVLGVGSGGYEREFEAFGFPFGARVSQMQEVIRIVKMLWSRSVVDYNGKFYQISKAVSLPKPLQKPHPPIWIGGKGPRMLRLTAELADGWINTWFESPKTYSYRLDTIKKHARKFGRSDNEIDAACYVYSTIAPSAEMAWKYAEENILPLARGVLDPNLCLEDLEEICIIGGPDEWIDKINEFIRAGAEHIIVKIIPFDKDFLKLYGEKVIPVLKEDNCCSKYS